MTDIDFVAAIYYFAEYQNGAVEEALIDGASPLAPQHRSSDTPWDTVVARGKATSRALRIVTLGGAVHEVLGGAVNAKILTDKSGVLLVYSNQPNHLDKDFYLPAPYNAAVFNADSTLRSRLRSPNSAPGWYVHSVRQESPSEIGVNITNDEEWPELLYCRFDEIEGKLINTGIARDRRWPTWQRRSLQLVFDARHTSNLAVLDDEPSALVLTFLTPNDIKKGPQDSDQVGRRLASICIRSV